MERLPNLDSACGRHLTFRDFVICGETLRKFPEIDNTPKQPASYAALVNLAEHVVDPLIFQFGRVELTYGFSSWLLAKNIAGRVSPKIDQHSAHELDRDGVIICPRGGAAVDLKVHTAPSDLVAGWLVQNTPFDRLYFYGRDRPVHVSYGDQHSRQITWFNEVRGSNRRVPRTLTVEHFLEGVIYGREGGDDPPT